MKKQLIVIGVVLLLLALGLSGCEEQQKSPDTTNLINLLASTDEKLGERLSTINYNFYNYYAYYDWATAFIGTTVIPKSTIEFMITYEDQMESDMTDFENLSFNFTDAKERANLNQLSTTENNLVLGIETMIADYQNEKNNVIEGIDNIKKYNKFIDLIRIDLMHTENLSNKLTIMNNKVSVELYEEALNYLNEIKNITSDSKANVLERNDFGILTYTQTVLDSYDLLLDAWDIYDDYLQLFIDGNTATAETKYTEYTLKYDEAIEAAISQSQTEINNQIDLWCTTYLEPTIYIFEDYYFELIE